MGEGHSKLLRRTAELAAAAFNTDAPTPQQKTIRLRVLQPFVSGTIAEAHARLKYTLESGVWPRDGIEPRKVMDGEEMLKWKSLSERERALAAANSSWMPVELRVMACVLAALDECKELTEDDCSEVFVTLCPAASPEVRAEFCRRFRVGLLKPVRVARPAAAPGQPAPLGVAFLDLADTNQIVVRIKGSPLCVDATMRLFECITGVEVITVNYLVALGNLNYDVNALDREIIREFPVSTRRLVRLKNSGQYEWQALSQSGVGRQLFKGRDIVWRRHKLPGYNNSWCEMVLLILGLVTDAFVLHLCGGASSPSQAASVSMDGQVVLKGCRGMLITPPVSLLDEIVCVISEVVAANGLPSTRVELIEAMLGRLCADPKRPGARSMLGALQAMPTQWANTVLAQGANKVDAGIAKTLAEEGGPPPGHWSNWRETLRRRIMEVENTTDLKPLGWPLGALKDRAVASINQEDSVAAIFKDALEAVSRFVGGGHE